MKSMDNVPFSGARAILRAVVRGLAIVDAVSQITPWHAVEGNALVGALRVSCSVLVAAQRVASERSTLVRALLLALALQLACALGAPKCSRDIEVPDPRTCEFF
ncbi:MAG: hypothetical protein H6832_03575 [Planctomycetes bacterium]|nr:hypothetical protein [Planctomycetota bacterium]